MVDSDLINDVTPVNNRRPPQSPTVEALIAAINGSSSAAKYPASWIQSATKLDLIHAIRSEKITFTGIYP